MIIPNIEARNRVEINYKNAIEQSQELKKVAESLRKRASELDQLRDEIRFIWKGHNAERFSLRTAEKADEIRNTASRAAEIADAIRQTAEIYRNAELASIAQSENVMPPGSDGS